jgi:hypothetical protein
VRLCEFRWGREPRFVANNRVFAECQFCFLFDNQTQTTRPTWLAKQQINRLESERDKLEVGQLAFTYELIMVQSVHLPCQIRPVPKTVKELETLFKEDWSERAQDETETESLHQHQTAKCVGWQAVQVWFLSNHKICNAIHTFKRLPVGSAHPFIDLSNNATFEKMKGSINEQFDNEDQDDLIHFAKRVRQLPSPMHDPV